MFAGNQPHFDRGITPGPREVVEVIEQTTINEYVESVDAAITVAIDPTKVKLLVRRVVILQYSLQHQEFKYFVTQFGRQTLRKPLIDDSVEKYCVVLSHCLPCRARLMSPVIMCQPPV